ncbi:hypothetical protein KY289_027344 [Solanum tuberosum]|nr:hypothetical protein KY289_027344 [Solanum tuberosum]
MVLMQKLHSGLCYLQATEVEGEAIVASRKSDLNQSQLWHLRLRHMSDNGLSLLNKRNLLDDYINRALNFCEHCVFGKQIRVKFSKKALHKTNDKLDYIHSDLWGPNIIPSKSGARYFMTLIDDYSKMVWVYFLKTIVKWKTLVERQIERVAKPLRTDNRLEFCNLEFNNFCNREGIVRHHTFVRKPQQNGVEEHMSRTLCDRA